MAIETTQIHQLANGAVVEITRRDSRGHKYIVDGGPPLPSVTGMLGHIEAGMFGIASAWTAKQIRLSGGDYDAAKKAGDQAIAEGNDIHDAIERFIGTGEIAENPAFMSWYNTVGIEHDPFWAAAETFIYHPALMYGGTLDAISNRFDGGGILWDWKTKSPESYWKYGGSLKDHAQVASYVMALDAMGSQWNLKEAKIAYIMRDGSGTDVIDVDLEAGRELFMASRNLAIMSKQYNAMTTPGTPNE